MDTSDPQMLRKAFESMDTKGTGSIGPMDLQKGLSNGTDRPFNLKTCKLMVAMFDNDNTFMINFDEFSQLWTFVNTWVKTYEMFDTDNSGNINKLELNKLFTEIGYRFSDNFYSFIIEKFSRDQNETIVFDDFLYICIMLHMLTGVFSKYDKKREGSIDLAYDIFVETILDVTTY